MTNEEQQAYYAKREQELLIYKEESGWEATGAPYRITSVKWKSYADILSSYGNTMMIREYRFSEHPEQKMLDDGWAYDHYEEGFY